MANEKNLIPLNQRTKEEQREIQRKGGIASGVSRSFRAATKAMLKEHPELTSEIAAVVASQALQGDLQAVKLMMELNGETTQQDELALKKKLLRNQNKTNNGKAEELIVGLQDDIHEEAITTHEIMAT